jgi:cell division protein FtsB
MTARHAARSRTDRRAATPSMLRRAVAGDRPYVLAFFVLLAVLSMMVVGPLQSYTAAAERVRDLEATRTDLHQRVAELQIRRSRLSDPEELELLARQRLGLVKPGEIPYIVSDGQPDSDQVRPDGRALIPPADPSVLQRVGAAFASLFRR